MDYSTPGFPVLHHLPKACWNSCPSSQWCHPTISSSVIPFSSYLLHYQGLFQWVSSLHQVAEVLELQLQHQSFQWIFRIDLLWDWLVWDPCSPRDSQESSLTPQFKSIDSSTFSLLHGSVLASIPDYWKNIALTRQTFIGKSMSLLFNVLCRFVIAFLPRGKHLLASWLHSPFVVILEPKKRKSVTVSIVSPSMCHEVMGPDTMILVLWMLSFKPGFSLPSFIFIKRLYSSSLLSSIRMVSSAVWGCWCFSQIVFLNSGMSWGSMQS